MVKIGDFGLAKQIRLPSRTMRRPHTAYVATRWYRAPEQLLRTGTYGEAADMWSVGATLAEMATGGLPLFAGDDEAETLGAIYALRGQPFAADWPAGARAATNYNHFKRRSVSKAVVAALDSTSPQFFELIDQLLQLNPSQRPTAAAAMQFPIFASFSVRTRDEIRDPRLSTPVLSSRAGTHDGLFGTGTSHAFDTPSSSRHQHSQFALQAGRAMHNKRTMESVRQENPQENSLQPQLDATTAQLLGSLRSAPFCSSTSIPPQAKPSRRETVFDIPEDHPLEPVAKLRSPAGFFDMTSTTTKRR